MHSIICGTPHALISIFICTLHTWSPLFSPHLTMFYTNNCLLGFISLFFNVSFHYFPFLLFLGNAFILWKINIKPTISWLISYKILTFACFMIPWHLTFQNVMDFICEGIVDLFSCIGKYTMDWWHWFLVACPMNSKKIIQYFIFIDWQVMLSSVVIFLYCQLIRCFVSGQNNKQNSFSKLFSEKLNNHKIFKFAFYCLKGKEDTLWLLK